METYSECWVGGFGGLEAFECAECAELRGDPLLACRLNEAGIPVPDRCSEVNIPVHALSFASVFLLFSSSTGLTRSLDFSPTAEQWSIEMLT